MISRLCTALSLLFLLISASVYASENIIAKSGFYFGGIVGATMPSAPSSSEIENILTSQGVNSSVSKSNNKFTYGAILGFHYAINTNFLVGTELSYLDLGGNDYFASQPNGNSMKVSFNNKGVQGMLTSFYIMSNGFNAFAKLGAIYETTSFDNFTINGKSVDNLSSEKLIPAVAVGLGYIIANNLNVLLQYEHTFGENYDDAGMMIVKNKPMTLDLIMLGFSYLLPN